MCFFPSVNTNAYNNNWLVPWWGLHNFVFRYIRKGQVLSLTSIHGVDAEVLEFEVQENSKITKRELKDLNFPSSAVIGGVIRRGEGYVTLGNFQFKPKDRVVVLARPECIHKVESYFN